ncbi:hypothetical protein KSP39_PZI006129 [Platanthera zijinensis]|uniref:Uncharacterized protein n=1 Tax=Platanthera zijinensis TaxID=2320716 RepID=A0AAP0BS41_9ASPA
MKARLESLACENKELGQYLQDLEALGKASSDDKTAGIIPWSGERREGGATLQDDVVIRRGQQRGGGRREEKWLFPGLDEEHKAVAIRRSLFSVALSILVGLTIWEAEEEEPGIPFVAALLTVAGMSMGRVVNFFLPIKNKAASDAVVLLIINCFMLGALSRPALPTIAPRIGRAWAQYVVP